MGKEILIEYTRCPQCLSTGSPLIFIRRKTVKNDERVNFQANERGQRETTEDIPRKKKKERKKERKRSALATAFHFFWKEQGFSWFFPVRERKNILPSSLPRFISIFLRAFCVQFHLASLPRHVLFLFPRLSLRRSWSRRARSSCFSPSHLLARPSPRFPRTVLSSLTRTYTHTLLLPPFLRPFHPFHNRHFVSLSLSLSPSFFLSPGRFIASSTIPRSSPPSSLSQPFPLSPRTLVPFAPFPLPSPPHLPKTLFSRGPFASTAIRHPFPSFSLLAPITGRGILPFFVVLFYIFVPILFVSSLPPSLSSSLSFCPSAPQLFLSPSVSICLFFLSSPQSFPSSPSASTRLAAPAFSSSRSAFYVFPGLSTRRLLASPRTFPFRGYRSRDDGVPSSSFAGKTQAETTTPSRHAPPPPFHRCCFAIPVAFRVPRRRTEIFQGCFPLFFSLALSFLSASTFCLDLWITEAINIISMTTGSRFCIKRCMRSLGPRAVTITRNSSNGIGLIRP